MVFSHSIIRDARKHALRPFMPEAMALAYNNFLCNSGGLMWSNKKVHSVKPLPIELFAFHTRLDFCNR